MTETTNSTTNKPATKSAVYAAVASSTGLTKSDVELAITGLGVFVEQQLASVGTITVPGLVKLVSRDKPATPEKTGIDPFTKQERVFKAKPASKTIRATPIKALKDSVSEH